jgi:predicted nucleic acid-binding protein
MMYLLDTNVISEFRKASTGKADRHVTAWASSVPAESMYISAVCILELETETLLMERRDPRQGAVLRNWMENHVLPTFAGRILPVDTLIAQRCAALQVPDSLSDRDSLIAATALVHRMTVVTRNVSHFERTGVPLLNPWQS